MYREVYLDAPNVGREEKKYLERAIDTGYVSSMGPFVSEFEENFAKYLCAKGAVSTQSGTAAIYMALRELGIKKDDEVIVPVLTFVATANPIIHIGARPKFVDVDLKTWTLDPKAIKDSITEKTKAIMPVHLYGNSCAMDEIVDIAKEYNLSVIEDATESLGTTYKGRYIGTLGDLGCFSFNGNKVITTGGGGMVVGNDTEKLKHIKFLINQARDESNELYHPEVGFNYRMTNIEAALGLAQLVRLNSFLDKKRKFNKVYREEFKDIEYVKFQEEYPGTESSFWLSCITLEDDVDVDALQANLKQKGIITRRIFIPLVEFPPYKNYREKSYKNAYQIYERGLCLPSSTLNSEKGIYFVCKTLKELI